MVTSSGCLALLLVGGITASIKPSHVEPRSWARHTRQSPQRPNIETPGEFPFPFGLAPVDLSDGTSIGALSRELFLSDQPPKYSSLDQLFKSRPKPLAQQGTKSKAVLGGLHPDEVFYADHDIVVIKGSGFPTDKTYLNDNKIPHKDEKPKHKVTKVRPEHLFQAVPLPFKYLNGNIPTIVKPDSTHQHEALVAASSVRRNTFIAPIRKREVAKSNAVHYQYQQLGEQPIVHYEIGKDGSYTEFPMNSGREIFNSPEFHGEVLEGPDREAFDGPERPTYDLASDVDVNYVTPLPSINHKAEVLRDSTVVVLSDNPKPPK